MFDAVGRKGRTKKLSPYRWLASSGIGGILLGLTAATADVLQNMPEAKAEVEEAPVDVKFVVNKPPPPPPPPPAPVPKQTTKPRKNTLTKKVVQKEIKNPEPTPPPPKDQPTPEPVPDLAEADSGGVPGGVPGGVLGGVLGGVVGGTPGGAPGDIKEIDFGDVTVVQKAPVVYPQIAKRNRITGTVVVEVTCSKDGDVVDVRWVSGNELFKDSVLEAVWKFRYAPQSISFKFKQPFNFTLK